MSVCMNSISIVSMLVGRAKIISHRNIKKLHLMKITYIIESILNLYNMNLLSKIINNME